MSSEQVRQYFDSQASGWDKRMPPNRLERVRDLLAPFAARVMRAAHILDLGAGTGILVETLRLMETPAQVISVDISAPMLVQLNQRLDELASRNSTLHDTRTVRSVGTVQADASALPLRRASFDMAIIYAALPHFSDQPGVLSAVGTLLSPDGCLIVLHEVSRDRINAIHSANPVLAHHHLPPGEMLRGWLEVAGLTPALIEDSDDHYLAAALKSAG